MKKDRTDEQIAQAYNEYIDLLLERFMSVVHNPEWDAKPCAGTAAALREVLYGPECDTLTDHEQLMVKSCLAGMLLSITPSGAAVLHLCDGRIAMKQLEQLKKALKARQEI